MSQETVTKKWSLKLDDGGIAWLSINNPDSRLNTLDQAALEELEEIVSELNIELPKGLVLFSDKNAGFIAGADIKEFALIKTEQAAREKVAFAHSIFNEIESLPIPKVALIHGLCLGGGLELALSFDYLIGERDASCKLGLPEVKLGIHPGYGGSVRLIERIGAPKAMDLMLSGRVIPSFTAAKMNLLDKLVQKRYFIDAALDYIQRAPTPTLAKNLNRVFRYKPARIALAKYLTKKVAERANPEHYPAPYALINLWRDYGGDRTRMLSEEINSIANLANTPSSHNLVRIFFLQEGLKAVGKTTSSQKVEHLHVIGAGVMGGDIAAWSALRGIRVSLQDQNPESIAKAISRAKKLFKSKLKVARLVQAAMDRLIPDLSGSGISKADMIIEAIVENLEIKQQVFAEIETKAKPEAILATNTSSIPIEEIAQILQKPSRLVGIHFFNPVAKMQLVEVVKGRRSLKKVIESANAYTSQISRLPVVVKSSPGFLVNRVLMPYLIEAVLIVEEGVNPVQVDQAATNFGMPIGPIELADVVGLDICLNVAKNLMTEIVFPESLQKKLDEGHLGKKSGQGFYPWVKGKPDKPEYSQTNNDSELACRMIYPLLNECVACLGEGVVVSADELDAGVIFATGFAPFRGGPIQMIRDIGQDKIRAQLEELESTHGARFKPCLAWQDDNLI